MAKKSEDNDVILENEMTSSLNVPVFNELDFEINEHEVRKSS